MRVLSGELLSVITCIVRSTGRRSGGPAVRQDIESFVVRLARAHKLVGTTNAHKLFENIYSEYTNSGVHIIELTISALLLACVRGYLVL